ncbi:hypothetical protein D7X33_11655 [Butyricicoccus sp. 1XD8-22]|nr:hypothetical protein D7X33_11655 [Butyricicoccus sp. 1XD8-22]
MFWDRFKKPKAPEPPRATTTDVQFKNVAPMASGKVQTSERQCPADCWETVECCITEMLEGDAEFVTLTLAEISSNVRYVQSCLNDDGIYIELGVEEGGHTRLISKYCAEEECFDIFEEFFREGTVSDRSGYSPTEFFV